MAIPASTSSREALERGQAFGLLVEAGFDVPALGAVNGRHPLRRTTLESVSREALDRLWSPKQATTAHERRDPHGRVGMRIEWADEMGYRIAAPKHGGHIVSPDGRHVRCALGRVPVERWQRLLFAQVLPLAAVLQGLELFHASCVRIGGRTLAFIAASGTGKTSIAVRLLVNGGSFVTDDVLALEATSTGVLAYPGAGIVAISDEDLEALGRERGRLGPIIGRSDKALVRVDPVTQSSTLDAIYFLGGDDAGESVQITSNPGDPQLLLSSSFISYVSSPAYLMKHLEVCARIAADVPLFEVTLGPRATSAVVAEEVARHSGLL